MVVIDKDVDEIFDPDHDPYEVTSQLTSNQQRQRQRQRQEEKRKRGQTAKTKMTTGCASSAWERIKDGDGVGDEAETNSKRE